MATNEAKMTLEEKVTQRIKSDTLMSLVGDEDAITELVRRAVHEALYQPVRVPRSYGGWDERDSRAVEAAREVAKAASEKLRDQLVKEMIESPEIRAEIFKALQAALPAAILGVANRALTDAITIEASNVSRSHSQQVIEMLRNATR